METPAGHQDLLLSPTASEDIDSTTRADQDLSPLSKAEELNPLRTGHHHQPSPGSRLCSLQIQVGKQPLCLPQDAHEIGRNAQGQALSTSQKATVASRNWKVPKNKIGGVENCLPGFSACA